MAYAHVMVPFYDTRTDLCTADGRRALEGPGSGAGRGGDNRRIVYALTRIYLVRYIRTMLKTLGALAEPNRLHIVELLRDGPRPVGEIAARLGLAQPQASKHLRVLSEAGVVAVAPAAQRRIYQLRPEPFHELDAWLATYRSIWEARLDRLETYLGEAHEQAETPEQQAEHQARQEPVHGDQR